MKTVFVSLTDEQKKQVSVRAKKKGHTVSAYIRQLVLEDEERQEKVA